MNATNTKTTRSYGPLTLAASLVALSMATACTNRAEKPLLNGDTAVTEPAPPPNIIPEPPRDAINDANGTSSAATTDMDSGTATATTDAMSGVEPKANTQMNAAPPAKMGSKSSATHSGKMKAKKSTKTETTTTKSKEVGAVSPIYDSTDMTSESGTTSSASLPITMESSAPLYNPEIPAPGRVASALTDWGVTYRINDAKAAARP